MGKHRGTRKRSRRVESVNLPDTPLPFCPVLTARPWNPATVRSITRSLKSIFISFQPFLICDVKWQVAVLYLWFALECISLLLQSENIWLTFCLLLLQYVLEDPSFTPKVDILLARQYVCLKCTSSWITYPSLSAFRFIYLKYKVMTPTSITSRNCVAYLSSAYWRSSS